MDEQIVETATGLGYVDLVEGTGQRPKTGDSSACTTPAGSRRPEVRQLADRGQPFVLPIGRGRVIKGWDEGVASMRVGGKRSSRSPRTWATATRGAGGVIPPAPR